MQQRDSDPEGAGEFFPGEVKEVSEDSYEAVICSAIDVLEPRNNLSVWKISMSTDVRNADKSNRFLDIYLDADTGKIYEFYVRTGQQWDDIDTDAMIDRYAEYLELTGLEKMRIKIRCWRRHRILPSILSRGRRKAVPR